MAEIGVDMGRFESSARLASWAGACPGNNESGGKRKSGRTRKGSKWLAANLAEAAEAAGAHQGHLSRRPVHPACGAASAMPRPERPSSTPSSWPPTTSSTGGVPYNDLGADWHQKRRPEAHARRLANQIEALGDQVTIEPNGSRLNTDHRSGLRPERGSAPHPDLARLGYRVFVQFPGTMAEVCHRRAAPRRSHLPDGSAARDPTAPTGAVRDRGAGQSSADSPRPC